MKKKSKILFSVYDNVSAGNSIDSCVYAVSRVREPFDVSSCNWKRFIDAFARCFFLFNDTIKNR